DNSNRVPTLYRDDRHNPVFSLHREVNRLFDDMFRSFDSIGPLPAFNGGWPKVEVSEMAGDIKVTAEIPGIEEKDLEILLDNDVLTLRGEKRLESEDKERQFSERHYGRFERRIRLGYEVEQDKIDARFRNGVLTVVLPKSERARSQVKRVAIKH
ncbi:MAG: Hsp20/alpha crystallin family protein, partial [Hyphomicrobiales bacterium]